MDVAEAKSNKRLSRKATTALCCKLSAFLQPLIATISLRQQSLPNTPQALWDNLPRLKYPIFEGISAIYCPDNVPVAVDGSYLSHFKSYKL